MVKEKAGLACITTHTELLAIVGVIISQHNDSLVNNITMIESYFMLNMNHFQYCELDMRTDPEQILKINLPSFTYY